MCMAVARMPVNSDIIPGKLTKDTLLVWAGYSGGVVYQSGSSPSSEVLVVDPSCSTVWVDYDASTGAPLPARAIVGGHQGSTLLYVARLWVSVPEATDYSFGFYDPDADLAYVQFYGLYTNTNMSILTYY